MNWQPIATAPRDGTAIMVYNAAFGIYVSAWTTRWTGEPYEKGYGGFPCGFATHACPDGYAFGKWDCQPSHWMPLPPPPS